jgi:hypothetical protein
LSNEETGATAGKNDEVSDGRVILLHGFSHDELSAILKAVKSVAEDPQDIAFAMSTPTNLKWRFRDIINDVRGDHEYLRENPPGKRPPGA